MTLYPQKNVKSPDCPTTMSATIVNNVLVLNVDLLEAGHNTYAVTILSVAVSLLLASSQCLH